MIDGVGWVTDGVGWVIDGVGWDHFFLRMAIWTGKLRIFFYEKIVLSLF